MTEHSNSFNNRKKAEALKNMKLYDPFNTLMVLKDYSTPELLNQFYRGIEPDPNDIDPRSHTPLMLALKYNDPTLVDLFLKNGANPNLVPPITDEKIIPSQYQPLNLEKSYPDFILNIAMTYLKDSPNLMPVIKQLVNYGATINKPDPTTRLYYPLYQDPLKKAFQIGNLEVFQYLTSMADLSKTEVLMDILMENKDPDPTLSYAQTIHPMGFSFVDEMVYQIKQSKNIKETIEQLFPQILYIADCGVGEEMSQYFTHFLSKFNKQEINTVFPHFLNKVEDYFNTPKNWVGESSILYPVPYQMYSTNAQLMKSNLENHLLQHDIKIMTDTKFLNSNSTSKTVKPVL